MSKNRHKRPPVRAPAFEVQGHLMAAQNSHHMTCLFSKGAAVILAFNPLPMKTCSIRAARPSHNSLEMLETSCMQAPKEAPEGEKADATHDAKEPEQRDAVAAAGSQEEGTVAAAAAGNKAVKEPVEKPPTLRSTGRQKSPCS
jgi:hypothetical protein